MQVDSRGSVYIFPLSRGDNRAMELLPQRIRARWKTFGLGRSSQRWTITILAAYLLNLNISSTSPHRPKVSLISPHKAEGLSAISASHTYYLCGSISSAALREESYYQWQHWFSTKGRASCPSKNNVRPIFQSGGVFLQRLCHFSWEGMKPPCTGCMYTCEKYQVRFIFYISRFAL